MPYFFLVTTSQLCTMYCDHIHLPHYFHLHTPLTFLDVLLLPNSISFEKKKNKKTAAGKIA